MATVSSTLQIYDRFSGPLKSIVSGMNAAKTSAQSMNSTMNQGNNMGADLARSQKMALLAGRAFKEAKAGAESLKQSGTASAAEMFKAEKNVEKLRQEFKSSKAAADSLKSSMNMPTGGLSGATREVQNLGNQAEKTGGIFKKMLGAQVIGSAVVSGISKVTSSFGGLISGAIDASDAMTKFQSTMQFAGQDNKAIETAKKGMKQYADETVYDTNTIANTTAQLAANGVDDYLGLTKAAGNLNAVAGGNADTFKSVAMMMTQTVGAGKLTTENWNQMVDAIPGASGKMQEALKAMGAYAGDDFREAMANGEISADEFSKAA